MKIYLLIIVMSANLWAMPNPSSEFCVEKGGTSSGRQSPSGGGYGVCVFKDGSECEEWAFMENRCKPGQMKKYEETLSKNPDLNFFIHSSGYSKAKDNNLVEESDANYYCYDISVENVSNHVASTRSVKLVIYGEKTEEHIIPALSAGGLSQRFKIYIPINQETVFAVINPDKSQAEESYDNNVLKEHFWRNGKELTKAQFKLYRQKKKGN